MATVNEEFIYMVETRHFRETRWGRELGEYETKQSAVKRARDMVKNYNYAQARVIKIQIVASFDA